MAGINKVGLYFIIGKMFNDYFNMCQVLGFQVDSARQAYILPDDKIEKFAVLRESILKSEIVDVKTVQGFAGKFISIRLAVQGATLFCREVKVISLSGSLKSYFE